jgi:hypothetical protein
LGNVLLFYWIYYISLWHTPILLCQCPWFSKLVFWWSLWVPAYSFHSSWVFDWVVFSFNFYFVLSSEILSSTCSTLLEWPSTVFFSLTKGTFDLQDFHLILFFLRFSRSTTPLYLMLSPLFPYLFFYSVFVLLWCLLKSSLSSFRCFCVFTSFLFVVSWNILSASCTFWLTMSHSFSMCFSVISSMISSLRNLMGINGLISDIYHYFLWVRNWVSIFFFSH